MAQTWGKPPSPYSILVLGNMANTQMLRLPSGSPKNFKIRTPTTLDAHNFVCRPSIKVSYEAKL
jgi:hypothetical protein